MSGRELGRQVQRLRRAHGHGPSGRTRPPSAPGRGRARTRRRARCERACRRQGPWRRLHRPTTSSVRFRRGRPTHAVRGRRGPEPDEAWSAASMGIWYPIRYHLALVMRSARPLAPAVEVHVVGRRPSRALSSSRGAHSSTGPRGRRHRSAPVVASRSTNSCTAPRRYSFSLEPSRRTTIGVAANTEDRLDPNPGTTGAVQTTDPLLGSRATVLREVRCLDKKRTPWRCTRHGGACRHVPAQRAGGRVVPEYPVVPTDRNGRRGERGLWNESVDFDLPPLAPARDIQHTNERGTAEVLGDILREHHVLGADHDRGGQNT